jgi:hypothetical protein
LEAPSFRDAPLGADPESILPIVVMDSGLSLREPRNDGESYEPAFNAFSISALSTLSILAGVTGPTIL